MDALGAYPEEVSGPIRQFASSFEAPASEIANTVQRWIQQNPLETMPSVTAPTSAAREVGQQAVSDIADAVRSGAGRPGIGGQAGYLPQGTMPGQLGLLPDQAFQKLLPQAGESGGGLLDQLSQQIDEANAAGNATRAAQIQHVKDMLAPLYGDRTSTLDVGGQGVVPGFEQEMVNQGPQLGMTPTQGGQGGLIEDLLNNLQPGQRTYTPGLPQASGNNLDSLLQSLYQNARETSAQGLPKGVTPDMVTAAHAHIDQIGNLAGTPHTDLNTLLRTGASPADIERFMSNLEGRTPTLGGVLQQARIGSMAGGLTTEGKVALGPIIQTAMRAPTGALHLALTGRASEIPAAFRGGLDGLAEGAQDALQTMRYGTNYRAALTRGESGGYGFKPGLDVIGSNPLQRAIGTGLSGLVRTHGAFGDISAGIGRGANAALGAAPKDAAEIGQQWAFRSGEYGRTGQGIANAMGALSRANPALNVMTKIVLPFYRVGYNVFTQGVEHSPVGLAGRVTDALQGKEFDSRKLTNNLFGVGMAAAAFKEASDGNITGDHPIGGNPKQSMRIAGQWVPLRTIGPASESLAQAADLYESARDNQGNTAGFATQLALSYVSHVSDETFLSSMGDFFNAVGAAKNYGNSSLRPQAQRELGYAATQYGKSLIPQEKLGEQALGLINKARTAPAPTTPATTPGRPAPVQSGSSARPAPVQSGGAGRPPPVRRG